MSPFDHIGPYNLVSKLGAGSRSHVWLSTAGKEGARLVLKLAPPGDDKARERVLHECDLAGSFDHPNVMRIHECGGSQGYLWLAMPFLPGPHKPLKLPHFRQLLMALNHVHANGVIHCNLSARKLMLDNGMLRVCGFGDARRAGVARPAPEDWHVNYAPEITYGEAVSGRTDVYSAAVVLYEILTGKPAGPDKRTVSADDPFVAPSVVAPRLGTGFDALIRTATAFDPAQRYGSAFEFLIAFDTACQTSGAALQA